MSVTFVQNATKYIQTFELVFRRLTSLRRQEANTWLSDYLPNLTGTEWADYRHARQAELRHIKHVRR